MKKLFFAAIFSIGLFTMGQAQILDYYVYNASSVDTWHYAMADAGPTPAIYELNIAPNTNRTGTINNFAFQLEWKAVDTNNCSVYQYVAGPTGVVNAPTSCFGTNATYQLGVIVPGFHYYIKVSLP